ncbi:SDR family NAD(P)-dependent oxidoreductase [Planktotalea sp.]|uniref:SDR family NAD(P)-dependent oxidoreductase n=1 Tax=Planktotalea sp. TaxID=2029877 RepID=UPI0025DD175F|nr:SDR family NAD(P)-dependent oxidoreductase [Planktotalea sp.]
MEWKNALIIGASGGIGSALSKALKTRGVAVTGLSRSADGLDVTDEASVERVLGGLSQRFDLIIIATGALEVNGAEPEKSFKQISSAAMMNQFAVNAIGPALILRHVSRLSRRDGPTHVAVLSARVGSITDNRLGGWHSYRAAKAAVNQIVRGAAIELARSHKNLTCVALHPGTVQTLFTEKYVDRHPAVPASEAAENLLNVLNNLAPEHTGQFYDWSGATVPW